MLERSAMPPLNLMQLAETELAAFLKAMTDAVGESGLQRAGDTWIQAMEALDWPERNHSKFFRRVSVQAICQLATNADMRTT
jgi:hypothetical protein